VELNAIKRQWSHYVKWQNCEIYMANISETSSYHVPVIECNFRLSKVSGHLSQFLTAEGSETRRKQRFIRVKQ